MTTTTPAQILTPPPALTWAHLFPSDAAFDCAAGPQWFTEQLAELPIGGTRPVAVAWNNPVSLLDRSTDRCGVVAVNCRGLSAQSLGAAGYGYCRQYAVLPSLKNARWFVPLDSPAVSSAAMSLYTPARWSANFKRGLLRLAMHARLPLWYRDQIWIAQRQAPPIEAAVNSLFPRQDVRWALSSGAPVGARNRKASALLISPEGRMLAFAKLARSDIAREIIANEADVLQRLSRIAALEGAAPRMIYFGEVDGVRLLAQTPLPGQPAPIGITPAHQRFLKLLQSQQKMLAAHTSTVARLPERLGALSVPRPDLLAIFADVLPILQTFDVPGTLIHGDFAPWNLRVHEQQLGAFDWEYGEPDGLPLIDEIHYRLQCGWLLQRWTLEHARHELQALARQRPLGLKPEQVQAIAVVYLLDMLTRLLGEGYTNDQDVVDWHRQLLGRMMPSPGAGGEAAVA